MISFLEGTALDAGTVRMGTSGLGFAVSCTRALVAGEEVSLWIHTAVRENDISLYGFFTTQERDLFLALTKVPQVGPSVAMSLLSQVGAEKIVAAALAKDGKVLTEAKGIGAKKASTIAASITIPEHLKSMAGELDAVDAPAPQVVTLVAEALQQLNIAADDAARRAERVYAVRPDGDVASLVSDALKAA